MRAPARAVQGTGTGPGPGPGPGPDDTPCVRMGVE